MEGSLWSCCQHSPGIHKPACECSARGSDLQGARGGQGRQQAVGSQLTLTHQLGTRRLVRCHAVRVAAACSGHSRSHMQGLGPCAETCSSPPCLAPSTSVGTGALGQPQVAPGTPGMLMAQGTVAAPKPQVLLSTLTAREGAWLQGRDLQGTPLCWGNHHPKGRPAAPSLRGNPVPCQPRSACMPHGREWGAALWWRLQEGKCQPSWGPGSRPPLKVLGWEQPGMRRGLPASLAQMSLRSFTWHGKEKESDRAL